MRQDCGHPLYYLDAETRKATLADLLTLAISKMRPSAFPSGKHLVARSYWSLVARVNLICKVASLTLVHNLSKVA